MNHVSPIRIWIAVTIIIIFSTATWLVYEPIPPIQLTRTNMDVLQCQIQDYVQLHRKLPARLSDLPTLPPDHGDDKNDAWGRPIRYILQPDGSVVLKSGGKDGKSEITSHFTVPSSKIQLNEGN